MVGFTNKDINILCLLSIFGLVIGFSFLSTSISQLDNECYNGYHNITEEDSDKSSDKSGVVGLSITMCVCILSLSVVGIMETLIHYTSSHCNAARVMIIRFFNSSISTIAILMMLSVPTAMFIVSIVASECIYVFSTFSIMYLSIALSLNLGSLVVIGIIIACIYPNECVRINKNGC